MGIGKTVLRIRRERRMTQSELGDRANLASSYVSRIENGRVQPSVVMLGRIAAALETSVVDLLAVDFAASEPLDGRCPVSASGNCIGKQLRSNRGRTPKGAEWTYGESELHLLRITDRLAHHSDQEIRTSLRVVLESLLERASGTD